MSTHLDNIREILSTTESGRRALAVCEAAAAMEGRCPFEPECRKSTIIYCHDARLCSYLRALLAEAPDERPEAPANEPDVLATNSRTDGRRVWWSGGAWLYPGQSVAVIDAPAEAPANQVCGYRWLDHLCELPAGHPGNHRCGHLIDTSEGLSECAATPPAPQLEAPAREPANPPARTCATCRAPMNCGGLGR